MDDSECKLNIDDVQMSVITSIFPAVSIEKRNDLQQVHSIRSRWSQYQSSAASEYHPGLLRFDADEALTAINPKRFGQQKSKVMVRKPS